MAHGPFLSNCDRWGPGKHGSWLNVGSDWEGGRRWGLQVRPAEDKIGIRSSCRLSREAISMSVCPEKHRRSGGPGGVTWMVVISRRPQVTECLSLTRAAWQELPTTAAAIPFPLPSKMSSTPPKLLRAWVHSVFCPFCLSLVKRSIASGTHACFLLPAADHLDAITGLPPRAKPRRRCLDLQGSSVHWPSPPGTPRESKDQA